MRAVGGEQIYREGRMITGCLLVVCLNSHGYRIKVLLWDVTVHATRGDAVTFKYRDFWLSLDTDLSPY